MSRGERPRPLLAYWATNSCLAVRADSSAVSPKQISSLDPEKNVSTNIKRIKIFKN